MKIGKILLIVLFVFTLFATSASADVYSVAGKLDFTGQVDTLDTPPIIGLSPKVEMYYVSNGDTTVTSQWYAISAGHPGGNVAYGTAQDVNNIYTRTYSTSAELSTYLQSIPTEAASETAWTDAEWSRE